MVVHSKTKSTHLRSKTFWVTLPAYLINSFIHWCHPLKPIQESAPRRVHAGRLRARADRAGDAQQLSERADGAPGALHVAEQPDAEAVRGRHRRRGQSVRGARDAHSDAAWLHQGKMVFTSC